MTPTFKTSEECELRLVAYTRADEVEFSHTLEGDMDRFPASAARVSFGNEAGLHSEEQDNKLMNYLADHQHMTPFEYQHATFMIECPLFIRSQIHRHRTFSFNEISRRYTSDDLGFWVPTTWRKQAEKNKQASEGQLEEDEYERLTAAYKVIMESSMSWYKDYLGAGVAREQARAILPQSLLTRFYMGGNLRNWAHFLKLRLDNHAQPEVRIVAQKIEKILFDLWPNSMRALMK